MAHDGVPRPLTVIHIAVTEVHLDRDAIRPRDNPGDQLLAFRMPIFVEPVLGNEPDGLSRYCPYKVMQVVSKWAVVVAGNANRSIACSLRSAYVLST